MSECFSRVSQRMVGEERWRDCYFRKLVLLYRKSPCLWKKDTRNYLDSECRHVAYARIHRAMNLPGVTFVEIILKIREMRRLYVNELKNLLEAKLHGRCYEFTLPWFHDLHRFLYPYLDYDETVELHSNFDLAMCRETEDQEPPSSCSCVEGSISSRDTSVHNFLLCNTPASIALHSTSSPDVCLPNVKTRRTSSRSCIRFTDTKKQLPVRKPVSARSSSYYRHREDLPHTRQKRCREFKICGLRGSSSRENTYDTDAEQLKQFSLIVTHYLKKLNKSSALHAQMKIQRILKNMLSNPKIHREMYSREYSFDRQPLPLVHAWQCADGIDPTLVDRSVAISIQPVSQSARPDEDKDGKICSGETEDACHAACFS